MTILFFAEASLNQIIALAAQGLPLILTIVIIPQIMQGIGGAAGKFFGKLNNPNAGPIDRLRKKGQEYAGELGTRQRGKNLSQVGEKTIRRQRMDADGRPMFKADGSRDMEDVKVPTYRKRGAITRWSARKDAARTNAETAAKKLETAMVSERASRDPRFLEELTGASMYGTEKQRDAAMARTRAEASGAYSKILGEAKESMKGELIDDNLDLDRLEELAKGTSVTYRGKTYGSDYRVAAFDALITMGQADRAVKVLTGGVPEDQKDSYEYILRTNYDKMKGKGHVLNDPGLLKEFHETGKVSDTALKSAAASMSALTPMEMSGQKKGVLQLTRDQLSQMSEKEAKRIRDTAREVFKSQAAQAQLSGETREILREIANIQSDSGPPIAPPGQAA